METILIVMFGAALAYLQSLEHTPEPVLITDDSIAEFLGGSDRS
jgi:hypothetical protein